MYVTQLGYDCIMSVQGLCSTSAVLESECCVYFETFDMIQALFDFAALL